MGFCELRNLKKKHARSILQAAGLDLPTHDESEIVGKITLRHAYEIAQEHAKDDWYKAR